MSKRGTLNFLLLVVLGASFSASGPAFGATYYLSPSGSDSNNGTSVAPWKTFSFALPRLQPGDTLILKDGTYTQSNSGFISIDGKSGTASALITIKAENERRAFLQGDGLTNTLFFNNCSYWILEGLRLRGADNSSPGNGDVARIYNSHHFTVRRFLVTHSNRYKNAHLFENTNLTDSLFEENELYYWHRHGISSTSNQRNIWRRNYANSRGYPDISGGHVSAPSDRGDTFITLYPDRGTILENNISEGQSNLAEMNAAYYGGVLLNDNQLLGNISLNERYGIAVVGAREPNDDAHMPHNNIFRNNVSINSVYAGLYSRSAKGTIADNNSHFGYAGSLGGGLIADRSSPAIGDGNYSIFSTNTLATGFPAYSGFYIATTAGGAWTFSLNYSNSYNNQTVSTPAATDASITNELTINPNLGNCRIWIPSTSPMKGAGKNGADIGANILYRYENGILTPTALWNSDGSFPHGAIITGVNDVAGASAFDVHQRLNVNTNGCSFPAGYGSSTVTSPSAPSNLRIVQ